MVYRSLELQVAYEKCRLSLSLNDEVVFPHVYVVSMESSSHRLAFT